jgi:hypothetical protein
MAFEAARRLARVVSSSESLGERRMSHAEPVTTRWKQSLKWFASEFIVVVAGILVALGLQAWWQNRQDSSRGAEHQQQILADVRATERTLRESIAIDRAHYATTRLLSTALYAPDPPTPEQTLAWLRSYSGWIADPRPVVGNLNALIQTGDIRLVSNPGLRRAIIAYASLMGTTWQDRDAQLARMVRANDLAIARLEAADLPPLVATPSEVGTYDPGELRGYLSAYQAAWSRLRADEQFRTAQQWRLFAYLNIEYYNQEMLAATTQLRKRLESSAPLR